MIEEFNLISGYGVFIGNANDAQWAKNPGLHQERNYPASQPPMNAMLFDRYHRPGIYRSPLHRFSSKGRRVCKLRTQLVIPLLARNWWARKAGATVSPDAMNAISQFFREGVSSIAFPISK